MVYPIITERRCCNKHLNDIRHTLLPPLLFHEDRQHVDGQGEDDGGVLLCGDGVESLEVSELQGSR